MNLRKTSSVLSAAAVLAVALPTSAAFAAERVTLLTPDAGDLVPAAVAAPQSFLKGAVVPDVPREAVAVSWASNAALDLEARPFRATSREYFVEVGAAELAAGVEIHTDTAGALVRVHPVGGASAELAARAALDPTRLELVAPNGRSWAGGSGMKLLVNADQMAKSGARFAPGTAAFRLADALGAGTFVLRAGELRAKMLQDAAPRYQIHVFQPESSVALGLQTHRAAYLHGDALVIEVTLADGDRKLFLDKLEGFVTSPAGRAFPVEFRQIGEAYRARLTLDADEAPAPGLWQAHVAGVGRAGEHVAARSSRVGFGVAVPTARLDGKAELAGGAGLAVRLGVETAASGRYEVRGALYGTVSGALVPLAVGHSADWLEGVGGELVLRFDAELLEGAEAPFEVRDLRLIDQGRMGLLHRQAEGLRIDG